MPEKKGPEDELSVLIEFLQRTKEGEYALVDPESIRYARLNILSETNEQDYYYGLS